MPEILLFSSFLFGAGHKIKRRYCNDEKTRTHTFCTGQGVSSFDANG
jgi:hypothetical protein